MTTTLLDIWTMTKEDREALIEKHIEERTCWRCGKSTVGDLVYSIDGSHAECRKASLESFNAGLTRLRDQGVLRKHRTKIGEGKTAAKVLQLLEDAGYSPDGLAPATGYWRHNHQDVMRWEVTLVINGYRYCCGSWETMTEFVRKASKYGFHVSKDHEIWANEGPAETVVEN